MKKNMDECRASRQRRQQTIRSLMFVPVLTRRFVDKAHERGADAIALDLEDAIAPEAKMAARQELPKAIAYLAERNAEVWIRVNRSDPELFDADIAAAIRPGVCGIILPKVETAAHVASAQTLVERAESDAGLEHGSIRLMADIETTLGVLSAAEIAEASPRLVALGFGEQDFAVDLGVEPHPQALAMPAQMVAMAAKSRKLQAIGLPGSSADFTSLDELYLLAQHARRLGFTGAACIHPKQVELLNKAFLPSVDELAWAKEVIAAFESATQQGVGALTIQGRMVDEPVYRQALAIVARCGR